MPFYSFITERKKNRHPANVLQGPYIILHRIPPLLLFQSLKGGFLKRDSDAIFKIFALLDDSR